MQTINQFLQYDWPGNVRELRNAVERRVITDTKDSSDAQIQDKISSQAFFKLLGLNGNINDVLAKLEKLYIDSIMESCNGNVSQAARQMGITRMGLYKKINRLKKR
jgi:DNA-binding NtrC family response regulator